MAAVRSFTEYVKNKCYNELYEAAEKYVASNWQSMNLYTKRVHIIGSVEMTDATVQRVYVETLSDMRIKFDVCLELELELKERNYHYDETDQCNPWIRIGCEGDLSCALDDWKINGIGLYSRQNAPANSLSDALVPCIPHDKLDEYATAFLRRFYPEVLQNTDYGKPPVYVDPVELANRLNLTIKRQRIREDATVFGQIYFEETTADLYDESKGETVPVHINAGTIVVDPEMYLLRSLGSVNNTIVHECVHWVFHKKVFVLEQLYNAAASSISCEVIGGAESAAAYSATEQMERQANQLTPRIQMPAEQFRLKAIEYIGRYMREMNTDHQIDVLEQVIATLAMDYGVSRQAAKIRMVEVGFHDAIGTYTYLDGHYVKPHSFRKGVLKENQTFSISARDVAIQRLVNPELRRLTEDGDYLFIDNHYVYNAPLYVKYDEDGRLDLTDYARSHMDECCLIFDMKVSSSSKIAPDLHKVCFLNRVDSNISFDLTFHNGYENLPQQGQITMRKNQKAEEVKICKRMTADPEQCMELLLDWRGMNYTDLADEIDRDPKTISRTVKGTTKPTVETIALICFGLHLPPNISMKLMEAFNCSLSPINEDHQWINEALHVKYPESVDVVREYLGQYGVSL